MLHSLGILLLLRNASCDLILHCTRGEYILIVECSRNSTSENLFINQVSQELSKSVMHIFRCIAKETCSIVPVEADVTKPGNKTTLHDIPIP